LRIRSLAANSSGSVFSASSCSNPIYRSTDRGTTWVSVFPSACVKTLAINGNGEIFGVGGIGILRSTDNGESWFTSLVLGFGVDLRPIAFNASGEIFVGSVYHDEAVGGIYRSVDNGDTWVQTSFPDTMAALVLAINTAGDVFAGTGFGVFRSTDNGEIWTETNSGFADLGFPPVILSLAVDPVGGDIFAATDIDGVYRSTDNGDSWVRTGLTIPTIETPVINSRGEIFAGSGSYFNVEPEGVFYSKDNGNSWTQINSGLTDTNVLILTVDSSGYVFAGTWASGVFRTVKSITE